MHLHNIPISVNNPENLPKTDRTDSPQLILDKGYTSNSRKGGDEVRNQVTHKTDHRRGGHPKSREWRGVDPTSGIPGTPGTEISTGKINPHNISL